MRPNVTRPSGIICSKARTAPLKNLTRVLYGAPGAGKSEILLHLRERAEALSTPERPVWVVEGSADMLHDAEAFEAQLHRQLPNELRRRLWRQADLSGGLNLEFASLSVSRRDVPKLPEFTRLTTLGAAINAKGMTGGARHCQSHTGLAAAFGALVKRAGQDRA